METIDLKTTLLSILAMIAIGGLGILILFMMAWRSGKEENGEN